MLSQSQALCSLGQVEAADPTQPPVRITHSTAAPNDLSGVVDAAPTLRKLGWRPQQTLERMIDEVNMESELQGANTFVNRQYVKLQWGTLQQRAGTNHPMGAS